MATSRTAFFLGLGAALACATDGWRAAHANSDCQADWTAMSGALPGVLNSDLSAGVVRATALFDDGSGPALHVAGTFHTAGGQAVANIARYKNGSWSNVGGGMTIGGGNTPVVQALAAFQDAFGSALYVGGLFAEAGGLPVPSLARWDGQSWSNPGDNLNGVVTVLLTGSVAAEPTAMYMGGSFTLTPDGLGAQRIARFDGQSWLPLGVGLNGVPDALALLGDGPSASLVVGGVFTAAGGAPAANVARWDGQSWTPLGLGVNGRVRALAAHDDGQGLALYAGGDFTAAGGAAAARIARWDGANWSALGSGTPGQIHALSSYDNGSGAALYVGGSFTSIGGLGLRDFARWNGQNWAAVGAGGTQSGSNAPSSVDHLSVLDAGDGPKLHVAGAFQAIGGNQGTGVNSIATWGPEGWRGLGQGFDGAVRRLANLDLGSGEAIYAAGAFAGADGKSLNGVARWDGQTWSGLGTGLIGGPALAIREFDDGNGPELYVGGGFAVAGSTFASRIARWDGQNWTPLGAGVAGPFGVGGYVLDLEVFDDGSGDALYVGGVFQIAGGALVSGLARWQNQTWSNPAPGQVSSVDFLRTFDDGTGAALYVAGNFPSGGFLPFSGIRRFDGQNLSPVLGSGGQSPSGALRAMEAFDDGSGPALFVAGAFTSIGGTVMNGIARWNGQDWLPAGGDPMWTFSALNVVNETHGDRLYAMRTSVDAQPNTSQMVRWNGSGWDPIAVGQNPGVRTLAAMNQGSEVLLGGDFLASVTGDSFLTRWACAQGVVGKPGCAGNPGLLSAPQGAPSIGGTLALRMTATQFTSGAARFYMGFDGTDGSGCGIQLFDLGELLLGVAPLPLEIAIAPVVAGQGDVFLGVPSEPQLVGRSVAFQCAGIDFVGTPGLIEFSNGLVITVQP